MGRWVTTCVSNHATIDTENLGQAPGAVTQLSAVAFISNHNRPTADKKQNLCAQKSNLITAV